jgi:hypothetical protein
VPKRLVVMKTVTTPAASRERLSRSVAFVM